MGGWVGARACACVCVRVCVCVRMCVLVCVYICIYIYNVDVSLCLLSFVCVRLYLYICTQTSRPNPIPCPALLLHFALPYRAVVQVATLSGECLGLVGGVPPGIRWETGYQNPSLGGCCSSAVRLGVRNSKPLHGQRS